MSGKAHVTDGDHGPALTEGVTTALNWLSVLPIRGATTFDRITGARVMASLPVVGVVFGVLTAVLLGLLGVLGVTPLLTAVLVVIMWELLNRMMHLDGLADVADALGSYAAPERAREILADPHTGLMGFSAVLFSLLVQVTAVAALVEGKAGWLVCFIPALSRLGGQIMARVGRTPLSPTGFGAMVVGTVRLWWVAAWLVALGVTAGGVAVWAAGPAVVWIVPAAGIIACVVSESAGRHVSRRFGGVNGDCIGAGIHLSAAVVAVFCAVAVAGMTG
ncbi:cobalamin-5-phosphate synthase [Corynebacterium efficiens YS-314]|uniref:Adenosylcobinamide-GDP ribazoletransferase n=1 Tax=Corynebacterium efficiens (strain DSM 44549 / YS-314 / AJ 12310 / JCM 11189 / NBRC 100395) TaxID=196164 RepID=COBS_COREF|nr:adenosylcobinamide-GDP ribazoletransferase [Corynebacterium efficiens]Q8FNQ1.1 RecName: Full=Adenosylcobinamide-GDP ribazoletransferase; AltName: Full=Cobalamin synthase; AltName: Full=Cobalamin-5'-phosphate synthase [Corynebacterium efficiens YS-314]EEW49310.1 cobalamin-5-phosphate synthase [Corynebacterium efficiens YS-314]BAC18903.1 putative cobalamin [5'-phosphate] synthase [Corynebacterium efficiens YS-314]